MQEPERRDLLGRVPLFAGLKPETLRQVSLACASRSVGAGEIIFQEGDPSDFALVVATGRVKVTVERNAGRPVIVALVDPGTLLGEVALFDRSPRTATLTAVRPASVVIVPRPALLELFFGDREFAQRYATHLVAVIRRTSEHLAVVATGRVSTSLAWCLARLAREAGTPVPGARVLRPAPTRDQLADMIGYTRERTTSAMTALRADGYVADVENGLRIDDRIMELLDTDGDGLIAPM